MVTVPFRRAGLALTASLALLAGCGGGGGGGGDGGGGVTPPQSSAVVITTANARAVAADGLAVATGTNAAASSGLLPTGVQVETAGTGGATNLRLAAAARVLAGKAPSGPALPVGVAFDETFACSLGGTLRVSGNSNSSTGLVMNDTLVMSASNCRETVEGVVTTMVGTMNMTVLSGSFINETTFPYQITMGVVMTNFSMTANGETTASNGDMRMELSATSATQQTATVSGTSMTNSITTASGTRTTTMKNYRQTAVLSGTTTTTTMTASIETNNPRLGSGAMRTYELSTPTPIVTTGTGAYTAGSLRVLGGNSSLTLSVTGTNVFSLQADTNGDGGFELTQTVTLAELEALQ